jgi:predicted GTPase
MVLDHAIAANSQTELTDQCKSLQIDESELENELENRIENLDKLLHSVHAALEQESFSRKTHALDLVIDIRMKIKASHRMLQVAKLLSEPARESMLLRVRNCLNTLEEEFASHLGVRMT